MTSFERQSSYGAARSVKKFGNLTEMNLELLNRHRNNIERLSNQQKWTLLNKEQINASSTVQQVKVNIIELEKVRSLINDKDLHKFDAFTEEVKLKAIKTVEDFILLGRSTSPKEAPVATEMSSSSSNQHGISYTPADNIHRLNDSTDAQLILTMVQSNPASVNPETSASWERLHEALGDLFKTIQLYSPIVQGQEGKFDTIEDEIETAHADVQQNTGSLGKAAKYKAAIFPVVGAVMGGLIGGPLGAVAGLKLGGAAAVSGGVVGYVGSQYLQQKEDEEAVVELNNLNVTRSMPMGEFSSASVKSTS
ncbi:hypothetical protein SNE40_022684 [Patella caerulea]